jgi:putative pyruvate formate lyase activating enzyme
MPQILEALLLAADNGLRLPIVWNSNGYETVLALRLLEGIVDSYMPDFKFGEGKGAYEYCRAPDYPERAAAAITEMHRQVGDLEIDGQGVARRGLLVRHLVMPNHVAGTPEVVRFLAGLSPRTFTNLMDQYRPCYGAVDDPVIGRRPTREEVAEALSEARASGLRGPDAARESQG